jgi:hypothetical protein
MHGLYSDWNSKKFVSYWFNQTYDYSRDAAYISDVNFKKFYNYGVFIEFHGCRIAEAFTGFFDQIKDTFAENFSEELGSRGIVVAHTGRSAPNHPNRRTDYRYGKVRIFKDGKLIRKNLDRQLLKFKNSSTP